MFTYDLKKKKQKGFVNNLGFILCLIMVSSMGLAFYIMSIKSPPDDVHLLNTYCENFDEKYKDLIGSKDISGLPKEKADEIIQQIAYYKIKYKRHLDVWSDSDQDYVIEALSDNKLAPILKDHVLNHSCQSYWEYINHDLPIIENKTFPQTKESNQ